MADIQAVLFDFGKVLTLAPNQVAWRRMLEIGKLSEAQLEERYWALRDDYDAGLLTSDMYWQRIAGHELSPEELRGLKAADVDLWTDMNAPMLEWVAALHAAGFPTGILSNMPDAMAEGLCARFDWIANFDHTVWSHALKMRKPDPAIYAAAIKGLNLPAANILFIDDKQENIEAAVGAGMQAILYRDHEHFVQEMNSRGLGHLLHPSKARPAVL